MTKPEHAQEHGQHLARDGDSDQEQGREPGERVEDEQLADGAACCETEDILERLGVARKERNGGRELRLGGGWNGKGKDSMENACGRYVRHDNQIKGCQYGGKDVLRNHHLRPGEARVDLWRREDVVLRGVRETIQEEINR